MSYHNSDVEQEWLANPRLQKIAQSLLSGAVIAYPTEGVWGLGCDPSNAQALQKILDIKQRPIEKGVILVGDSVERFSAYVADLPNIKDSGHITWLVKHGGVAPEWITGGRDTIALRVSSHPLVRALCQLADMPLVSTSANPSGLPAAISGSKVRAYFGSRVDQIAPGDVLSREFGSSEIRDASTGRIIRAASHDEQPTT